MDAKDAKESQDKITPQRSLRNAEGSQRKI